jgi:large conductance mechanosensitive channel
MAFVRKLWSEFKAFAMSGSLLDLALGFIIGAAFAKVIESLTANIMLQFIAAIGRQPDFTQLTFHVGHGRIKYGAFLTDLINFIILAFVLFIVVKVLMRIGIGRNRIMGERQCPYCLDQIAPGALICRSCGQQLVEELPSLAEAERRLAARQARRITIPSVRRKPGGTPKPSAPAEVGAAELGAGEVGAAAGAAAEVLDE